MLTVVIFFIFPQILLSMILVRLCVIAGEGSVSPICINMILSVVLICVKCNFYVGASLMKFNMAVRPSSVMPEVRYCVPSSPLTGIFAC